MNAHESNGRNRFAHAPEAIDELFEQAVMFERETRPGAGRSSPPTSRAPSRPSSPSSTSTSGSAAPRPTRAPGAATQSSGQRTPTQPRGPAQSPPQQRPGTQSRPSQGSQSQPPPRQTPGQPTRPAQPPQQPQPQRPGGGGARPRDLFDQFTSYAGQGLQALQLGGQLFSQFSGQPNPFAAMTAPPPPAPSGAEPPPPAGSPAAGAPGGSSAAATFGQVSQAIGTFAPMVGQVAQAFGQPLPQGFNQAMQGIGQVAQAAGQISQAQNFSQAAPAVGQLGALVQALSQGQIPPLPGQTAPGTPGAPAAPGIAPTPAPPGAYAPAGAPSPGGLDALNLLSMILGNPQLQQALQTAAAYGAGAPRAVQLPYPTAAGTRTMSIPLGAVMNTVGALATEAMSELNALTREDDPEVPEYLVSEQGELVVDPASSEERAALVAHFFRIANEAEGLIESDGDGEDAESGESDEAELWMMEAGFDEAFASVENPFGGGRSRY